MTEFKPMKKGNLWIGVGMLACATFIGAIVGIPLMMYGMWSEYVNYTNTRDGNKR